MELISGENFQSLAQISFYTERNCIIDDQLKSKPQNAHRIADFNVNDIKKYNKIFVYTHFIKDFFSKFWNYIPDDLILISHNSDDCIDESFRYIADYPKLKLWYCQNRAISHSKLISIPIGIANSQWPHGKQNIINCIRNVYLPKTQTVYKNFSINTNTSRRSYIDWVTNQNNILMSPSVSNFDYLNEIKKSLFVISPPGNGLDCHRNWECLALGSIPIIENHECFSQWKDLPILFTDEWYDIKLSYLTEKYSSFNLEKGFEFINMDYWRNII